MSLRGVLSGIPMGVVARAPAPIVVDTVLRGPGAIGGRAPELGATGLKLVGGRLLPGPTGPASFLMYESASGERFTVYTARAKTETTQMRYAKQDGDGALFWADRGVGYVVSGGTDRERLTQVARLVYDQSEKSGG